MKNTFFFCTLISIFLLSCNKYDVTAVEVSCDGSTPTYDGAISNIINTNCAISGCHPEGTGHIGDYSTYASFEKHRNNGWFEKQVLKKQYMPKGFTLSQDELNTIMCWVENGFPEN
jgi:hypothetical protein